MRRIAHLTCAFALLAALAGCSSGIAGTPAVGSTGFGPTSAASPRTTTSTMSRSSNSVACDVRRHREADTDSTDTDALIPQH